MKTLFARKILINSNAAKAAMIAVPLGAYACSAAKVEGPKPPSVVVVDIPRAVANARPELEEPAAPKGDGPKQAQIKTVINISYYPLPLPCRAEPHRRFAHLDILHDAPNPKAKPFCGTLEARLSVIRPDDSLEKVILDPKANFSYIASDGRWNAIAGCEAVTSCDVAGLLPNGQVVSIRTDFAPDSKSPLKASSTVIWIDRENSYTEWTSAFSGGP